MNTYSQVFLISFGLLISGTTHSAMAMGDFVFRNSSYASNLTIQAFVVTKDQICSLIEDMNDSPAGFRSKSHDELSKVVNTYLFIRIKNEANQAAWGTLSCRINHRDGYEVNIPFISAHQNWIQFIIESGGIQFPSDLRTPDVDVKWKNLYAK